MSIKMPDKIWARNNTVRNALGYWIENNVTRSGIEYIRTDLVHKVCVIQFNEKQDCWEMLSDGSLFFRGYDDDAEIEEDDDSAAWSQFPAGTWQLIAGDIGLKENIRDLKSEGYQVIVIPKSQSKAQIAQEFWNQLEKRDCDTQCQINCEEPHCDGERYLTIHEENANRILKEWEEKEVDLK